MSMHDDSAVRFETDSLVHLGLAVKDLGRSVEFYRKLLGQAPTKTRSGYAKFETAEPPLNLALNQSGGATGPNNAVAHFGIQVKSTAAVRAMAVRFQQAGLPISVEENVTCCYAVQNKVWATDPDGNKWEVFVVLDNNGAQHQPASGACCAEPAKQEPARCCL